MMHPPAQAKSNRIKPARHRIDTAVRAVVAEALEGRTLLAGAGLSGQYFDNADLSNAKLTRVDAQVNFDWGTGSPNAAIASTTYSARWTGAVEPTASEVHTFHVRADDGVRLWVDNQLIVNNWTSQAGAESHGQIALRAGRQYAVKLEYFQNTAGAAVALSWSSKSTPKQLVPTAQLYPVAPVDNRGGALQEVWTNIGGGTVGDLTGNAAYPNAPAFRQVVWSLESSQQDWADNYGQRLRGYIIPQHTGAHAFAVAGNDNVQLSLSTDANPLNATVVAFTTGGTAPYAYGAHASQQSSPINLVAGRRYYFEVLHKEWGGFDHFAVAWRTPRTDAYGVIGSDYLEPFNPAATLPATGALNGLPATHDRVLATPQQLARAKALVAQGGQYLTWYNDIKARANAFLNEALPPTVAPSAASGGTQPILAGIEDNLEMLAGAFKLVSAVEGSTVNAQKYFDKARQIILNVCQWSTWDTGIQFLGAGMASAGIAVCYDWMYDQFTPAERQTIATALYQRAIKPATDTANARNYWTQWYGNWAFVTLGGTGLAALAIAPEFYKAESEALLKAARPVLRSSMTRFAGENGGWHEGPGYMGYGTLYLIRFMSALQTGVGTDFGLSSEPGFQQLPNYLVHGSTTVNNNANNVFPFADGDWSQNGDARFLWLATRFNRTDVAATVRGRMFTSPWSLLWHDPRGTTPAADAARTDAAFYGDPNVMQWGTSGRKAYSEHVNIWRDGWAAGSSSVMFKGGYQGVDEHDNLDGGSFIFDALGTRWATDLYHDSYALAQVGGTNYGPYRKRAEGQNTLVINPTANDYLSSADANERALNADQVYKDAAGAPAYAPVVRSLSSDVGSEAIVDLSALYAKMRVSSVQRGVRLDRRDGSLTVQDEVKATAAPDLYWFMHLNVPYANRNSHVAISADGKTATITLNGNRLQCRILSGTGATFSVMAAAPLASSPQVAGQATNDGASKLTVHYTGSTDERLTIWMVPLKTGQTAPTTTPAVTPLSAWAPQRNAQAWAGDVDAYTPGDANDATPAAADSGWVSQIVATTGKAAKALDDVTANRVTPITLNAPLLAGQTVSWAKLTVALKGTGGATGSDLVYLDSTVGQSYAALGWGAIDATATAREIVLSPAQLSLLNDGKLNLAFAGNVAIDFASLAYTTAQGPVVVNGDADGAARDDVFRIAMNNGLAELFANGAAAPVATWEPTAVPGVTVNGLGGNDSLTIDYTNGDPIAAGGIDFDGGVGSNALLVDGAAGGDAVTLGADLVTFNGDALRYANARNLTLTLGTNSDVLGIAAGATPAIDALRLNVAGGGKLSLAGGAAIPAFTLVNVDGATFDLGGINRSIDRLTGSGAVTNTGAAATLTLGAAGGSSLFGGAIDDGAGAVSLAKIGAGTIELTGASSYSGVTNVFGGALRVGNAAALGSSGGATWMQGGINTGRLELTGGITLPEPLLLLARNATDGTFAPHIVNLAGSNTLSGAIATRGGGLGYTIQSDAGLLTIAGNIVQGDAMTYSRPLHLKGTGNGVIAGFVQGAGNFNLDLTKFDAGQWTVQGGVVPSGSATVAASPTTVNGGTLVLGGTLARGAVAIHAGTLRVADGGARRVQQVTSLTIGAAGLLDTTRNVIEVAYAAGTASPLPILNAAVMNGNRAGAPAVGARIIQTSGVAGRTVGIAQVGGVVRVGYAAYGDGDMDGAVTITDINILTAAGFNGSPMAGSLWTTGDYDHDGYTTLTDINLVTVGGLLNKGYYV